MKRSAALLIALMASTPAFALPESKDRVYAADQNSNTVSVIDPSTNTLLGLIKLGDPRPNVLSPLYKGEVNVHGLGFSPDHRTIVAVSTVTNSVTFIDTATNKIKGVAYIGRNPHEAFFTPDGKHVWATVRGEDYLSVIDAKTFKETDRIKTESGPGMTIFTPDGKRAFVANSFNPVVQVFDVASKKLLASIPVVSPFSPFIQVTPDGKEAWLTHKDVGKVTRIDTKTLKVKGVIDSGPITNHLAFAKTSAGTLAYVTIGGENVVKVYTLNDEAKLIATIPVGALPHGVWGSGDGSRVFVGLENGDAVDVIDTQKNEKIAHIPSGQAPQALIYVPDAVPIGDGRQNLEPRKDMPENITLMLKPAADAQGGGMVVSRNLGLIDIVDLSVSKLKPDTAYALLFEGQPEPIVAFKTDAKGAAMASATSPTRSIVKPGEASKTPKVILVEGTEPSANAVLQSN
ncbi:YncE family protein [Agrobacterium burrii]|uniref:YncE family protein n=1 Tax=Agrobacterium burrii TaxID=2815339 RepID=A0ABS3EPX4_9HYPH|nr:YncE family protein [Agrobacterium burrii]MBO0134061.1 YncE family protein [Agrobacterium burrii]